ncbi:MAG: hypothetical protein ACOWWO_11965 [Peptococcaceae bacterium]
MPSIEFSGLQKLTKDLNDLLDEIPGARQKLHEEIAEVIKKEAEAQVEFKAIRLAEGLAADLARRIEGGSEY